MSVCFHRYAFQSRNRETFDSNFARSSVPQPSSNLGFNLVIEKLLIPTMLGMFLTMSAAWGFNLVIEKLLIPTFYRCLNTPFETCFNLVIEKLLIPTLEAGPPSKDSPPMFQSRNRETFDSNRISRISQQGHQRLGFNLVIEKLLIPTPVFVDGSSHHITEFQSRNRETFDSNTNGARNMNGEYTSFNLVIEKLLIPTNPRRFCRSSTICFNLVIEKLLIPTLPQDTDSRRKSIFVSIS